MEQVSGKVAFITGAASGIGYGMAQAFADAGMRVMLADIEVPRLEKATEELRGRGAKVASVVCDVSERSSVFAAAEATLGAFGKVHVVCNNAGVSSGGLIQDLDAGDWSWVVGVNLMGVVHGCQAFVPHLRRQREGGHVVNTASMAGLLAGPPGWTPYHSTKWAVVGLTEVLRNEGRDQGFSASVLCPGAVNTNILDAARNRPARFGPQRSKVAMTDFSAELQSGLAPRVVGDLVLEAIRADRLHIFTDPRLRTVVERGFERVRDDFAWAAASESLRRAGAPGALRS
jgi:NAD(P)-dependent dehydrogenase (short-subunit alcohol dehydrogenase family)